MGARTTEDAMTIRRFPPPWDIEEANAACFIVRDHNGQARSPSCIARMSPGDARGGEPTHARRSTADCAANIAKLPELLKR